MNKLDRLGKRTWAIIKGEWRLKNGSEVIARASLRVGVPAAIVTEDVDILAFHLPGLFRLLGWRRDRVLHVVWIDPNGDCYRHD